MFHDLHDYNPTIRLSSVCRVVFQETVLNINKPFTSKFSGNIRYDVFSVDFVISFQYITCLYDFYTDESFVNLQRKKQNYRRQTGE